MFILWASTFQSSRALHNVLSVDQFAAPHHDSQILSAIINGDDEFLKDHFQNHPEDMKAVCIDNIAGRQSGVPLIFLVAKKYCECPQDDSMQRMKHQKVLKLFLEDASVKHHLLNVLIHPSALTVRYFKSRENINKMLELIQPLF